MPHLWMCAWVLIITKGLHWGDISWTVLHGKVNEHKHIEETDVCWAYTFIKKTSGEWKTHKKNPHFLDM